VALVENDQFAARLVIAARVEQGVMVQGARSRSTSLPAESTAKGWPASTASNSKMSRSTRVALISLRIELPVIVMKAPVSALVWVSP
jgi:hypothetical protein